MCYEAIALLVSITLVAGSSAEKRRGRDGLGYLSLFFFLSLPLRPFLCEINFRSSSFPRYYSLQQENTLWTLLSAIRAFIPALSLTV